MAISELLVDQYGHSWKMLRAGIDHCPDEQWRIVVDDPFFVPARVAFHIIQTVEFYTSERADDFDWQAFGFDWEESPAEGLPDKSSMIEYLDAVEKKLASYLQSMDDKTLQGSDAEFAPYFKTPLARMMYALRHSHHHIGQLSLDLQRRNLPEITW